MVAKYHPCQIIRKLSVRDNYVLCFYYDVLNYRLLSKIEIILPGIKKKNKTVFPPKLLNVNHLGNFLFYLKG